MRHFIIAGALLLASCGNTDRIEQGNTSALGAIDDRGDDFFSPQATPEPEDNSGTQVEDEKQEDFGSLDPAMAENAVPSPPAPLPRQDPLTPIIEEASGSKFSCSPSKTCPQMNSCEEAYYHLNECGDTARDRDGDGVPCENICG